MQTEQQRLQIFSHGRHVLPCLCFVLTATLCPAQMLEVDLNPPDTQKILDHEKSLVAEPSPLLLEHEQIILAESQKEIWEPVENNELIEAPPLSPPIDTYNAFVYPPQRKFLSNPLTAENVTLPPMPYQLTPFGNPPRRKQTDIYKPLVIKPTPPTPEEITQKEAEKIETQKQQSQILALSPFLEWVKQNKEKAVEVAQESVQQYKKEPPPSDKDNDLFLSIRFPYKGTEPSGNSVAIYSTPEK